MPLRYEELFNIKAFKSYIVNKMSSYITVQFLKMLSNEEENWIQ